MYTMVLLIMLTPPHCNQLAQSRPDENQLTKKLLESIEKKIPIAKVEAFVGKKAAINTIRSGDRDALEVVNIGIDKKRSQTDTIDDAKDLVYWVFPAEGGADPRLIGIMWTKKSEMKLFYGIVLPR